MRLRERHIEQFTQRLNYTVSHGVTTHNQGYGTRHHPLPPVGYNLEAFRQLMSFDDTSILYGGCR